MRLITITNLYPSADLPRHGIFVQERLRQLIARGELTAKVIALRPGRATTATPAADDGEIPVRYVHVPSVRGLSNWVDPWLWARAAEPAVREALHDRGRTTILDGHFLYPDGAAVVLLARRLGMPVVLTARGSDVNVKCKNPVMRRWIRWAAARCDAVIAVSQALAATMRSFNVSSPRTEVIPNGVDLERFAPHDRDVARRELDLSGRVLVSVGHLIEAKGHQHAIAALKQLSDVTLLLVGEGADEHSFRKLADDAGVADRVRFLGIIPHEQMSKIYSASDALVLMSAREGMPNVVLESLACGTRVIASGVGGVPEVVQGIEAGVVTNEASSEAVVSGLCELEANPVVSATTRAYARTLSWDATVRKQLDLYCEVAANHERANAR